MANILGIGVAVLDIINTVDGYPPEDAKVRALSQRVACGGNAANTLAVLATLGHHCALAATFADDADGRRLREDLSALGVDTAPCRIHASGRTPVSYILHNRRNGSRTIVHHRELPEYDNADFARLALANYDWLHFEGRSVAATRRMLEHARAARVPMISLEVEKPRDGIEALFDVPPVLLFGRDYVSSVTSAETPEDFLRAMHAHYLEKQIVCAWGKAGAYAIDHTGELLRSPAFKPEHLVDTLGAGDTFNAGMIDALLKKETLAQALASACRLAGEKCGTEGIARVLHTE
ncbi:MAG: PfkB family carbohydrate kinase [Chromatiales bacterium]|jgi:ketohexokinase|nr:PfkB family carbohydrate kinase [Chromatiales bacterium]